MDESKDSKSSLPNKIAARRSLFPEEENRQSRRQHIGAAEICQEQTHRIHGGTIAVPHGLSGKMKIGINQEWQAVQDSRQSSYICVCWELHQATLSCDLCRNVRSLAKFQIVSLPETGNGSYPQH
jgi:hypothetical protein